MKNTILLSFLMLSILTANAQDNVAKDTNLKKNEVKINGYYLIFGAFEGTYERILNEESAVGISIFLPIDNNVKDIIDYYISPYYRMYFGKKHAAGFFIEGFGMLNSIQNNYSLFSSNGNNKTTDFALGLGIGGKWITKRGFIGEINYGLGRNLFNANESNVELVFKVGINIGYRF
ncbi:MAG: DUF3575 domain-containing protein [Bacteroidetes bacterium]|nr:DUF3575 domain-containing protein [Bacteroidota bacterium]